MGRSEALSGEVWTRGRSWSALSQHCPHPCRIRVREVLCCTLLPSVSPDPRAACAAGGGR